MKKAHRLVVPQCRRDARSFGMLAFCALSRRMQMVADIELYACITACSICGTKGGSILTVTVAPLRSQHWEDPSRVIVLEEMLHEHMRDTHATRRLPPLLHAKAPGLVDTSQYCTTFIASDTDHGLGLSLAVNGGALHITWGLHICRTNTINNTM